MKVAANSEISEVIALLVKIAFQGDADLFLKTLYQLKHLKTESYYLEAAKTIF